MAKGNVTAQHFFAGTVGLAMLRTWYENGDLNAQRINELAAIMASANEFPHSLELNPEERPLHEGYAEWAASYDDAKANPMIDAEQRVVRPLLERLVTPGCVALDVACGTGRHAEFLFELGCDTTGVDSSPEMLDVARSKVPAARFEVGTFESLPLANDVFDFAVCALALCHLPDPTPGIREIARVLKPGGSVVIADPHPVGAISGGQAFYGGIKPGIPMTWVRNYAHLTSIWLRAFRSANLEVVDCQEVLVDDALIAANPTSLMYPDAARAALHGLPYLFVWELRKPLHSAEQ